MTHSKPHYVIRVDGTPFRIPLVGEVRLQAYQQEQLLAKKRKHNEQRLLAALEPLIPEVPPASYWCERQSSVRVDLYKVTHEAEVEDILRLLADKPPDCTVDQLRDADNNSVASLVALFGSAKALKLLMYANYYYGFATMYRFAKIGGHKDCLKVIIDTVKARNQLWYFTEEELQEGSHEGIELSTIPPLQKACAAVLAHELCFDITSSASSSRFSSSSSSSSSSSPSPLWSALVQSASEGALEQILSSICNHLPLPQRGQVLMHFLAHHSKQMASLLSTEAQTNALMACDKYWRDMVAFPAFRRGQLFQGRSAFGDVLSVFDTPAEMWRIEPEDAFERQHKIFPHSNATIKKEALEEREKASVVTSRETFGKKMEVFSQGQLKGLNWENLLVLGGAVVACLLPSPFDEADPEHLDQYFTNTFGEGTDLDLCLHGIEDKELIAEKVVEIYTTIVKAIPEVPVTAVSSGESITFLRHHPYRPIQIMGAFHSITEVLHGIDLDCTCVAFDGKDVWALPRAWMAFNRRWNLAHGQEKDIYGVRGCPHYEQRLVKYAEKRGFAVVDRCLVRDEEGNILEPPSEDKEALLAKPDHTKKFNWVYSGDDEGEECYPAVGLKLLLLCERHPCLKEKLLSLRPVDSIPYGKDWPAEKVIQHLKVHSGRSRWEAPSQEDEWKAEFNHFDGYTRYHRPPELVCHSTKEDVEGGQAAAALRAPPYLMHQLHLMANHSPFLVPNWLQGMQ
ncbi:hypothetical protein QOT17_022893 [Balamuthia mandrillaris]